MESNQPNIIRQINIGGIDYKINAEDSKTLMGMSLDEIKASVVQYDTAQDLTEEQQAQARENIDAVSSAITEQEKNGNNLLDPANTESGYYDSAVGAALIAYNSSNHQRTIEPIPLDDINTKLYFYSDGLTTDYDWIASIKFVDGNGNLTGTFNFRPNSTDDYTIPSWYGKPVAMHVWISGVSSGASLSKVCLSTTKLDAFEPYQEPKTVIKKEALSAKALKEFAPLDGKTIVNFGDSIFGNTRPPRDISTEIAKLTGATVYNCGFGGCRMAEHSQPNFDAFSMYRLAYAIAGGDFTVQESALEVTENAVPDYFSETLALLKSIDFNDVDIVTIAYGTNDFTGGVDLDNNMGSTSFGGALRISVECLLYAYPHLKIFICSPIYRFWPDTGKDSDTYTPRTDGVMLSAFVEKDAEIAKEYHLPFINNYDGLGFNRTNRGYYFSANDGTHPNEKGNLLIAANIADALRGSTSAAVYGADANIPDILTVQTVNANSMFLNGAELTGYVDEFSNKKYLTTRDGLAVMGDVAVAGEVSASAITTSSDINATGSIISSTEIGAPKVGAMTFNANGVEFTGDHNVNGKSYLTTTAGLAVLGDIEAGGVVHCTTLDALQKVVTPTVETGSILGDGHLNFDINTNQPSTYPLSMFAMSYSNGNRYFLPNGENTYLGEPTTPWDNVYATNYKVVNADGSIVDLTAGGTDIVDSETGSLVAGNTETNSALSPYTTVTGTGNTAGMKGFRIIAQTGIADGEGTYTLDSVEGLEVGDIYSVRHTWSAIDRGSITAIDASNNTVTVDTYFDKELVDDEYVADTGMTLDEYLAAQPWRNTLSINAKPNIGTLMIGVAATAEGRNNMALRVGSHVEGNSNIAIGEYSHVEGQQNTAGHVAHAEGRECEAVGEYSHAEGRNTHALGFGSHAEGFQTYAHAKHSHAEGYGTAAAPGAEFQHVQGKFNVEDPTQAFIIGGGSDINHKKNINTVDWNGNAYYSGNVATDAKVLVNGLEIYKNGSGQLQLGTSAQNTHVGGALTVNAGISINNNQQLKAHQITINYGNFNNQVVTPKIQTNGAIPLTISGGVGANVQGYITATGNITAGNAVNATSVNAGNVNADKVALKGAELTGYTDENSNKKYLSTEDNLAVLGDIVVGSTVRGNALEAWEKIVAPMVEVSSVLGNGHLSFDIDNSQSLASPVNMFIMSYRDGNRYFMPSGGNTYLGVSTTPWDNVYARNFKLVNADGTITDLTAGGGAGGTDGSTDLYTYSSLYSKNPGLYFGVTQSGQSGYTDILAMSYSNGNRYVNPNGPDAYLGSSNTPWNYIYANSYKIVNADNSISDLTGVVDKNGVLYTNSQIISKYANMLFTVIREDDEYPLDIMSVSFRDGKRYIIPAGANTYLGEPDIPWDNVYAYSYYKKDMETGAVSELATQSYVDTLVGDMEAALDAIIAAQQALIGGSEA